MLHIHSRMGFGEGLVQLMWGVVFQIDHLLMFSLTYFACHVPKIG